MNWIEEVNVIKNRLLKSELTSSYQEILNAQLVLGTPGEMYSEIMNILLKWKKQNNEEYISNRNEIEQLINYGYSIGYINS
ncbi:MAG: hypothetical protein ABI315_10350 [Bacteroidia bacterium]